MLLNAELAATTLLAFLFFGEHLGRRVVGGTALVVAAGALLAWEGAPELRIGSLLIVGACACWGLDNCVTAELDSIAPEHITFAKGVVAGSTNVLIGLAVGGSIPGGWTLHAALAVGAVGYGLSITLWVAGARELGAARSQLVFAPAPFVGVLVAWTVLGDDIRGIEMAALVLASVGVLGVLGSGHEHPHAHRAVDHDHAHAHAHAHEHDEHHAHDHAGTVRAGIRHTHSHHHEPIVHAHPHVPDLHHRHEH